MDCKTFDQDFNEKVKEIALEILWPNILKNRTLNDAEFTDLYEFAKRFYNMGKED